MVEACLCGSGLVVSADGATVPVADCGLPAGPGVSKEDSKALAAASGVVHATVLYAIGAGLADLVTVGDAWAVLSAEAMGLASSDVGLSAALTSSTYQGARVSGAAMRVLMAGSVRGTTLPIPAAWQQAPYAHGLALDAAKSARAALKAEHAALETGHSACAGWAAMHGVLALLNAAAQAAVQSCTQRSVDLGGAAPSPSVTELSQELAGFSMAQPSAGVWAMLHAAFRATTTLSSALAAEWRGAEALLMRDEAAAVEKVASKASRRADANTQAAIKAAEDQAAFEAKVAAMDDKAAEKARQDWAKRQAKAAAKAAKKSAKGGDADDATLLPLGSGARAVLTWLRAHAANDGSSGGAAVTSEVRPNEALCARALELGVVPVTAAVPALPTPLPEAVLLAVLAPLGAATQGAASTVRAVVADAASGGGARVPKIPKGTRDFGPAQMQVRRQAFDIIRAVFQTHGAGELDTPVFELRDTLMGKYGEEGGKLVYDLADQGGESLCMRYDLTVPFARYLAASGLTSMKRYAIGKVYRRDAPAISRGRYREFYQCDFDIAGEWPAGVADAETLSVLVQILRGLPVGSFSVKLNHRMLLDAMLQSAGVPAAKTQTIASSIDKLDKEPWSAVRTEMVVDKGLPEAVADAIGAAITPGKPVGEGIAELRAAGSWAQGSELASAALEQLDTLNQYLELLGVASAIKLDLSLARGLDYYTGVIFEAVLTDPSVAVGSIAAGGRYDGLVGSLSAAGAVPCVGCSIGVERVFAIMEARAAAQAGSEGLAATPCHALVASVGKNRLADRVQALGVLWNAGVSAEMIAATNPNMKRQLEHALETGIPFMITQGEDEVAAGTAQVKDLRTREELEMPLVDVPAYIKSQLSGGATGGTSAPAARAPPAAAAAAAASCTGTAPVARVVPTTVDLSKASECTGAVQLELGPHGVFAFARPA